MKETKVIKIYQETYVNLCKKGNYGESMADIVSKVYKKAYPKKRK